MKVNVEVECTPEEARRFMGLPDLTPVHDAYIAQMQDAMKNGMSSETIESLMKNWGPVGETGMKVWQQLLEQVTGPAKR
ncbi:DUF6489 family protein [Sphingomonas sp.]|uniref:DUF6489 family protein n=1 Tax=Sphingomonas sp. TaxID=28214 RepID=UPI0025D7A72A|nr:DUF6489 family protein [Sphingomonas sp.]